MDQPKIGNFIKELRKEQNLTQEQFAEKFNVARRTVSRWETGSNLPDIDVLIEMADLFDVDLREILNGERTQDKMNQETKETALAVAEYENANQKRITRTVLIFFIVGIMALLAHLVILFVEPEETILTDFIDGMCLGLSLGAMILGGLFITGRMNKIKEFKMRLLKGARYE